MSNTEQNTMDCTVICDLMIVYASGEASEETTKFIETHLEHCPECQEIYEAAQRGEGLLAELEPVERPLNIDGRKILLRIQRVFFGVSAFVLLVVVMLIASAERWVVQGLLGIPLPQLYVLGGSGGGVEWLVAGGSLLVLFAALYYWRTTKAGDGEDGSFISLISATLIFVMGLTAYKFMLQAGFPGALVGGTLVFTLYIFLLRWRVQQASQRFHKEFLYSLEASIPLLILVLGTLTLMSSGGFPEMIFSAGLLVVALVFTLVQLSNLPYMTLLTLVNLLVGGFMLIGNAFGGFASLFDYTMDWPAALGHPVAGVSVETASKFDLLPLGFVHKDNISVTEVGNLPIPDDAEGFQSLYANSGGQTASVILIRFDDQIDAREYFTTWRKKVSVGFYDIELDLSNAQFDEPNGYSEHPLSWQLALPGIWFGQEGQIARSYNENTLTAHNAWQTDNWVTLIKVQGGVVQALPLSRQIKEVIAEDYDIGGR